MREAAQMFDVDQLVIKIHVDIISVALKRFDIGITQEVR
jgi:hypothetical protein